MVHLWWYKLVLSCRSLALSGFGLSLCRSEVCQFTSVIHKISKLNSWTWINNICLDMIYGIYHQQQQALQNSAKFKLNMFPFLLLLKRETTKKLIKVRSTRKTVRNLHPFLMVFVIPRVSAQAVPEDTADAPLGRFYWRSWCSNLRKV